MFSFSFTGRWKWNWGRKSISGAEHGTEKIKKIGDWCLVEIFGSCVTVIIVSHCKNNKKILNKLIEN